MTHTPTPWAEFHDHPNPGVAASVAYIRKAGSVNDALEIASLFGCVASSEQKANAEFIVKAVNAHDELVAAVDGLKTILEIAVAGKDGLQYANIETRQGTFVRVVEALQDAESALEKAGAA
jgi:hypothetical protein